MLEKFETERLVLKVFDEGEIDSLVDFYKRNKNFFEQWMPYCEEGFYTREYQLYRMNFIKDLTDKGIEFRYQIFKKEQPERIIGNVVVSNIVYGVLQSGYLGYSVDEKENGKGYAAEAVKKMLDISFNELGLHRLEASVIPANTASVKVLEKLNFIREGYSEKYLKINGKWEDHLRFALINENS